MQNQVNAYLFNIQVGNKTIGRIVVGSSLYNYCVFEAGNAPPPALPSSSELTTSINKSLAIQTDAKSSGKPQLVYLGYDSYAAVYNVQGKQVAFDLRSRSVALTSELKSNIVSPEQYSSIIEGGRTALSFGYYNLPVPQRDMNDGSIPDGMQNNNNCGPTSGAMIMEYYKQYRGYSNLFDWPTDHNMLYYAMSCNVPSWPGGVMPWNAGPGFVQVASFRQYNFSTSYNLLPMYSTYSTIQSYINTQRPIMILFLGSAPYAQWHWCAIRGWWTDDSGEDLIINNPWNFEDFVSWEANYNYVTITYLSPS